MLEHLRRWLEDESRDKRLIPLDTSSWPDVVWDKGTPRQRNGSDCGVFMSRTADFLASDAVLSFQQADMPYLRQRMVLEILHTTLLPL